MIVLTCLKYNQNLDKFTCAKQVDFIIVCKRLLREDEVKRVDKFIMIIGKLLFKKHKWKKKREDLKWTFQLIL